MNKFKEHFKVNGGTFKTSEDEIEAYVKKRVVDFYVSVMPYSTVWGEDKKEFLAKVAYEDFKTKEIQE